MSSPISNQGYQYNSPLQQEANLDTMSFRASFDRATNIHLIEQVAKEFALQTFRGYASPASLKESLIADKHTMNQGRIFVTDADWSKLNIPSPEEIKGVQEPQFFRSMVVVDRQGKSWFVIGINLTGRAEEMKFAAVCLDDPAECSTKRHAVWANLEEAYRPEGQKVGEFLFQKDGPVIGKKHSIFSPGEFITELLEYCARELPPPYSEVDPRLAPSAPPAGEHESSTKEIETKFEALGAIARNMTLDRPKVVEPHLGIFRPEPLPRVESLIRFAPGKETNCLLAGEVSKLLPNRDRFVSSRGFTLQVHSEEMGKSAPLLAADLEVQYHLKSLPLPLNLQKQYGDAEGLLRKFLTSNVQVSSDLHVWALSAAVGVPIDPQKGEKGEFYPQIHESFPEQTVMGYIAWSADGSQFGGKCFIGKEMDLQILGELKGKDGAFGWSSVPIPQHLMEAYVRGAGPEGAEQIMKSDLSVILYKTQPIEDEPRLIARGATAAPLIARSGKPLRQDSFEEPLYDDSAITPPEWGVVTHGETRVEEPNYQLVVDHKQRRVSELCLLQFGSVPIVARGELYQSEMREQAQVYKEQMELVRDCLSQEAFSKIRS